MISTGYPRGDLKAYLAYSTTCGGQLMVKQCNTFPKQTWYQLTDPGRGGGGGAMESLVGLAGPP